MPVTLTPHEFVAKWRDATRKERSGYVEHFLDICRLLGHPTPGEADRDGRWFTFEAFAHKLDGRNGFADVWKRGYFAWEYKGPHADLKEAYRQLQQYRDDLENPPLLIVSDYERILIRTNFTNTVQRTFDLALDDLLLPEKLAILRAAFENPAALQGSVSPEYVTEIAAQKFAELAKRLRDAGHPAEPVAHFLIRLLFCLFAEDADILPGRVFSELVRRRGHHPAAFAASLRQLFDAMATGGMYGPEDIPHIDGGLFEDALPGATSGVLPLDAEGLRILADVSGLDWSAIEPSILGTLFERGLDPDKRSQLGAHYTSRADILLIVEPVLMAPWRRRWDAVRADAEGLAGELAKLDAEGVAQRGAGNLAARRNRRTRTRNKITELLLAFRQELAAVQVLDPACGSGNFLYVALRSLLDLEHEAIKLAVRLGDSRTWPVVHPRQLHGIEVNPYAYELAQATIWIGYLQWLRENGYGSKEQPILEPLAAVQRMDAILRYDADGAPCEPGWPAADVIIGNPPFLGDKKMRSELGDKYVDDLRALYAGRVPGGADLVTYWFEKARAQIEAGKATRAGLLATNSIRQQGNRPVLNRIKATGNIFMAWSDREWMLDGAAVRVSLVGFDDGNEQERNLDGCPVVVINSDLTAKVDVTAAAPLAENAGICFLGMMKAGPFDIDGDTARRMLAAPINPNGRPNSDVVRRRLGGQDVAGRARDTWIIDFGTDMTLDEAAMYELPFEYVKEHVKPIRETNRRARTRERWWIFGESRPGLRRALVGLSRCIVTPEVTKHRVFVWMDTTTLPDHKLHVFARDDDYFLGVLQSRIHETWTLAQCAWLGAGNDPSYSSSRTFETYPFPWPPGSEPIDDPRVQAIGQAAAALVAKRDAWLNPPGASEAELRKRTLTNLYNERPTWLSLAHAQLDAAVFAAYGWPAALPDEDVLARLLELNRARAAGARWPRPSTNDGTNQRIAAPDRNSFIRGKRSDIR